MKKISTVQTFRNEIFKEQKLTIGVDLGDRWSFYCVLDEACTILLEQKVATTPEAMKQTFGKIPRSLIAMETGTHSPWVSRLLTELGHKLIVAHAQKVELITKSNRKDDRHDARTLARLARIDAELLGPVRHRSAKAQIHLTVIRARAELVSARTALVNAARGLVKSYGQRLPKCGTQQVNQELAARKSCFHGIVPQTTSANTTLTQRERSSVQKSAVIAARTCRQYHLSDRRRLYSSKRSPARAS
jgi:transposase